MHPYSHTHTHTHTHIYISYNHAMKQQYTSKKQTNKQTNQRRLSYASFAPFSPVLYSVTAVGCLFSTEHVLNCCCSVSVCLCVLSAACVKHCQAHLTSSLNWHWQTDREPLFSRRITIGKSNVCRWTKLNHQMRSFHLFVSIS